MSGRLVILLGILILAGCAGRPRNGAGPIDPGPLPRYEDVARAHNRRVALLDRLYTFAAVRIWYVDGRDEEQTEVLDSYLNIIRPRKVLLVLNKVGQTYAVLGSDDERYWWMELGDQPRALVGEHAKVTVERVAELGLPVQPLELLELLGITPLPDTRNRVGTEEAPRMRWAQDGRSLIVTAPGLFGPRRLWLDPRTYEPSRVELLDDSSEEARPVAWADLSRYIGVEVRIGDPSPGIAGDVLIGAQDQRTRVRLRIEAPENRGRRPRPDLFDFDRLARKYRVREVISVDEEGARVSAAP